MDHSQTEGGKESRVHGFQVFQAFTTFISNEILFVTQIYKPDTSDTLLTEILFYNIYLQHQTLKIVELFQ